MARIFVILTLLLASSCQKEVNTKDALRQAVIDHLATRKGLDLNMSSLNIVITTMNVRENEADATISFEPRGGGNGMTMKYTFEKQGSKWAVKAKQDGGSPHAAEPHGGASSPHGGMMPPPAGGGAGELPPSHPPIGGAKK